jgi:acyl carrier protein
MQKSKVLLALDELLELTPGTLKGPEKLSDYESWDSLAVISFIAFVDEEFGTVVSSDAINNAQTVDDLAGLAVKESVAA